MHTFEGNDCYIHYNGDFSGDVIIVSKTTADAGIELTINCHDLLKFAAEYVTLNKISALEQADWDDILLGRVQL